MPGVVSEFAHIRRMRNGHWPYDIAMILPGEYFVSDTPMIVSTVLGSCISACIRDPVAGVGGMNHFMLPTPTGDGPGNLWGESARYGSFAMEMLINAILKRGGLKSRLEIKLFGGGTMCDGHVDIGSINARWARDYLNREGLRLLSVDVGARYPRKVYYFTDTGKVLVNKIEQIKDRRIQDKEGQYRQILKQTTLGGDVTLFKGV